MNDLLFGLTELQFGYLISIAVVGLHGSILLTEWVVRLWYSWLNDDFNDEPELAYVKLFDVRSKDGEPIPDYYLIKNSGGGIYDKDDRKFWGTEYKTSAFTSTRVAKDHIQEQNLNNVTVEPRFDSSYHSGDLTNFQAFTLVLLVPAGILPPLLVFIPTLTLGVLGFFGFSFIMRKLLRLGKKGKEIMDNLEQHKADPDAHCDDVPRAEEEEKIQKAA